MNDLNLIPYEVKIQKEKRIKKRRNIIILILVFLMVGGITSLPIYFTYKIDMENRALQREIDKLSYVTEEINTLNVQKKITSDQVNMLESILKDEIKWTEIIDSISVITPGEISVNNMNGGVDGISMNCKSQSSEAVAVFAANLENSERFTDVKVNEIVPNENEGNFSFSLSFKLKSTEGVVK